VFDLLNGIPAHPLFVHAPLVLIPLTLLLGLAYVMVPPLRPRVGWALVLLAIASPVSAFAATQSGERLEGRLGPSDAIEHHQQYGETLQNLAAVLMVVALLLVLVDRLRVARKRRQRALAEGDEPAAPVRRTGGGLWTVLSVLLSVALLGVGGATGTYLYLTGDSGAKMVWQGTAPR
jgi:uncharacterized membrane protein